MKSKVYKLRAILIITLANLLISSSFAQSPEKMSYQAVIRNSSNVLVTSAEVGMRISILQGTSTGTVVYVETQAPTTNINGLVSIEIGGGTGFDTINWANGPYFIKTETDPEGGTAYTISGTSQLLSVPYALHANTAETLIGTITETDPIFGASVASEITATDTTNWDNKLDSYTETDPVYGSSIASGITATDTINWNNKLDTEVDGSVINEIQALSISNDTVFLSNGGFVKLPVADGSETKVTAGTNVTVTGAGTIASPYVVNATGGGTHYLGEEYLNGIIFNLYIGNDGLQHGLVVSKTETATTWGGNTLVGADRTEDGAYNMSLMPTGAGTARTWVQSLGTSWYLPSIDELSLLWHSRYYVNKTARSIGSTLLTATNGAYWSSTETIADYALAYYFVEGDAQGCPKAGSYKVRAVLAF